MLSQDDLRAASAQAELTRQQNDEFYKREINLLKDYNDLIEEHRHLKSENEELRWAQQKPERGSKDTLTASHSYVLILIDGNEYLFHDKDMHDGIAGGLRAADHLHDRASKALTSMGLQDCNIMVRIYFSAASLMSAVMKARPSDDDSRYVTDFVLGFNQRALMYDFIDVGCVRTFKMFTMLDHAMSDWRCKHIFLGSSVCAKYLSQSGRTHLDDKRVSLISHASVDDVPGFRMKVNKDFAGIFQAETPGFQETISARRTFTSAELRSYAKAIHRPNQTQEICPFSALGICKFGTGHECGDNHLHIGQGRKQQALKDSQEDDMDSITSSTQNSRAQSVQGSDTQGGRELCDDARYGCSIPTDDGYPARRIALNKDDHRLDCTIESPINSVWAKYKARSKRRRLCPDFHLDGSCRQGVHCRFDHAHAGPDEITCLRSLTRLEACRNGGKCRQSTCKYGHICTRHCEHQGGFATCKLPRAMHLGPDALAVSSWVPAQNIPQSAPKANIDLIGLSEHDANGKSIDVPELSGNSDARVNEIYKHDPNKHAGDKNAPHGSSVPCPGGWPALI